MLKYKKQWKVFIFIMFTFFLHLNGQSDRLKRSAYLDALLSILSPDDAGSSSYYTPVDSSWRDWLLRTKELPPNFESLSSHPLLPPLIPPVDVEGGFYLNHWDERRETLKQYVSQWLTGSMPIKPKKLAIEMVDSIHHNQFVEKELIFYFGKESVNDTRELLSFLKIALYLPTHSTSSPVILLPGTDQSTPFYPKVALARGYGVCIFEPSEDFEEIYQSDLYSDQNDFTLLACKVWACQIVIDFLSQQPMVQKDQIGIMGRGLNGLLALLTGVIDERISAVIIADGGIGSAIPFRFSGSKFGTSSLGELTSQKPAIFHPRLRFFVGREHKIPFDVHYLSALVAPRGLLYSINPTQKGTNPWALDRHYLATHPLYKAYNKSDHFSIHHRSEQEALSTVDMQSYIDFLDYIFGGKDIFIKSKRIPPYSFQQYLRTKDEWVFPQKIPKNSVDEISKFAFSDSVEWLSRKSQIQHSLKWLLELPDSYSEYFPELSTEHTLDNNIIMDEMEMAEDSIICEPLYGGIFCYSSKDNSNVSSSSLPTVIYHHSFNYSRGYRDELLPLLAPITKVGYAVFAKDMMGFGSRWKDTHLFYQRYSDQSILGNMVKESHHIVSSLLESGRVDSNHVYLLGNTLGGKVGLMSAALDERICGTISINSFYPWRDTSRMKDIEGLLGYYELYGLIPKLGYYKGIENEIPVDYNEIIACIAPRPTLVISSVWNRDANVTTIREMINNSQGIYDLFQKKNQLQFFSPHDILRTSPEITQKVSNWLLKRLYE